MKVEALGPSISAITVVISAVAPARGAAGLGRIGPVPFSTIVNERPVGVAALNHVTRVIKKRQIRQSVVEYQSNRIEEQTHGN